MNEVLVDSNVILDVFEEDPNWVEWSESMLNRYSATHTMYINPVIYSEVSAGFERIEELEEAIAGCGFRMIQIPKEALFLAGKAFIKYRKRKGMNLAHLRCGLLRTYMFHSFVAFRTSKCWIYTFFTTL